MTAKVDVLSILTDGSEDKKNLPSRNVSLW